MKRTARQIVSLLLSACLAGTVVPATVAWAADAKPASIYVSPEGNDSGKGTIDAPFKTLQKAQNEVRNRKSKNAIPDGGIEVVLRGGEYHMDSALRMDQTDSGTAEKPVVYKSADGEEAIITTNYAIDSSKASAVTDNKILQRLPEEAQGKVMSVNLGALGIKEFGEVQRKIYSKNLTSEFELFYNNEPLKIAQWPNNNYILTGEILDDGTESEGITFRCDDERIKRWTKADQALLYGFWRANWGDDSLHLKSVDAAKGVIDTVETPSLGINSERRFYIYNLLEEIDQPGEYFLDRKTGILYFYPPSDPANASIRYSTTKESFVAAEGASYITFEGIVFDGTCGDGLSLKNGEAFNLKNCKLRNIAGRAVNVEYINNGQISGCEFSNIGNSCIIAYSGNRNNLIPGNFDILDNHFYKYARYNKTYNPAIGVYTVGSRVANNCIHDAPHVAIMFSGNENIIENNEIYDVLQETDDCGAIYAGRNWTVRGNIIRNNYLHDIIGPGSQSVGVYFDDSLSGNSIIGNVFRNVTMPILMGGGRDNVIENNLIVEKTQTSPSAIVADDRGLQSWYADPYNANPDGSELHMNLKAMPYQSEIWKEKYPELTNILDDEPMSPKNNSIRYNISSKHARMNIAETVKSMGTVDSNWETQEELGLQTDENGKLFFKDSGVLEKFKGFREIDFKEIGLTGNGNYTIPDFTQVESGNLEQKKELALATAEPILIEDLIGNQAGWQVNKTNAQFSGEEVTFGSGVIGYGAETFGDGAVRLKLKLDEGYGWAAITVRSSLADKAPWEGSNGYVLVIKESTLELQRWAAGTNVMMTSLSNTSIPTNEWCEVEFMTVVKDMTTYIVVRVNNEEVIALADDDPFAIKKTGYITAFNGGAESKMAIGKAENITDREIIPYIGEEEKQPEPEESLKEETEGDVPFCRVYVDDREVKATVAPEEVDGSVLFAIRPLLETLGYRVEWNDAKQTVTATAENSRMVFVVGDAEAVIDGKIINMPVAPKMKNGTVILPVRFAAENAGMYVEWADGSVEVITTAN